MNDLSFSHMDWVRAFEQVEPLLCGLQPDGVWATLADVKRSYDTCLETLPEDLTILEESMGFVFSRRASQEDCTGDVVELIRGWSEMERAPSLLSIGVFAAEKLRVSVEPDFAQAFVIAAVLGEVPHDLSYHGNIHFKKVLLQVIRLIRAHNDIYEGTDVFCDSNDILFLMVAACVHDLGHDGKGNTVQGVYKQARLERMSYYILLKYFNGIEFSDKAFFETFMDHFRIVLLCTDASPVGDPASFASQMKSAYKQHFLDESRRYKPLNLDPELKSLEGTPKLAALAMLLHEADIATSAGLSYPMTAYETTLFYDEFSGEQAKPSHVLEFMNTICTRETLSPAAQKLYSANMARIRALADQDIQKGDAAFPDARSSVFLQG